METAAPDSQAAFIAVLKAYDCLHRELSVLLKANGMTEPQFNVLRILRGAGAEGLSCQQIGERMITRVPDITRLLDRLDQRGLIVRGRSGEDRRVVLSAISDEGLELLKRLDRPVASYHRERFSHLSERELKQLLKLLRKACFK